MLIVTAIYLLMNLAYAYVLPIDAMAQSKLVAADVAEKCFAGGARWIAVAVMISTLGATNFHHTHECPSPIFPCRGQNVFPRFIGNAHPRFHTPGASLLVQGVWSVLLAVERYLRHSDRHPHLRQLDFFMPSARTEFLFCGGSFPTFPDRTKSGLPVCSVDIRDFRRDLPGLFTIYNDITIYREGGGPWQTCDDQFGVWGRARADRNAHLFFFIGERSNPKTGKSQIN